MSDLQKQYAELKKQMAQLQEHFAKDGKAIIKEAAAAYFSKHQWVPEFTWPQYTDYFNDGEPTRFGVYDPYLEESDDWWGEPDPKWGVDKEAFTEARKDAEKLIYSIDKDLLLALFGDHCKVTLTPKKVHTEEYTDHC